MQNREKQIEEMRDFMLEKSNSANVEPVFTTKDGKEIVLGQDLTKLLNDVLEQAFIPFLAEALYTAGYRKQSEDTIELPCKVGDLVHFKGLETPWKVSAIHIYEEGQPQISITSETGKITSTMTANEFYMFCSVLTDAKMKGGAE